LIPQINITAQYNKKVVEPGFQSETDSIRSSISRTATFEDGRQVILMMNDPIYYIEEVNTPVMMRNFDIEIFEVLNSSNDGSYEQLSRKNIKSKKPQVVNGFLVSTTVEETSQDVTTDDVEYYFDVLTDDKIDQQTACKGAGYFNKKSYYVDLDFDCEEIENREVFYDIYGTITEPEVCLD
jgi:hypothetical protein